MILYHKKLCLLKYVLRSQTIIFAFMITDDRIEHFNVWVNIQHSTIIWMTWMSKTGKIGGPIWPNGSRIYFSCKWSCHDIKLSASAVTILTT